MKKLLSLLLLILILSFPLFSQPDYPIISKQDFESIDYTIIEKTDDYAVVESDGDYYLYLYE